MIVVHHLENSRSQRVLWLLEELGVPYEVKRYARDPRTMLAPPELRALHPLGKSPIVVDGEIVLAETGAVVEYLVERYGGGRLIPPAGTPERLAYTYWLHYAEGSAMPPFLMKLVFLRLPLAAPALLRPMFRLVCNTALTRFVEPQIAGHVRFWEGALSKSAWFAGPEFTAADVMMSFPLEVAGARATLAEGPSVAAFLETIHARPAYQRALERGGPYRIIG
jgi:glutathione S-transferase